MPVGRYLPEWFAKEPDLRVEHLLWQTSGLADFLWLEGYRKLGDEPATPLEAYVALDAAAPRRFEPGTRWAYSNTNYKALALIAERVGGAPFDRLLAEHVPRPLGIAAVTACHGLDPREYVPGISQEGLPTPLDASRHAYTGDGGLCGNAAALATWLERAFVARGDRPAQWSRLLQPARLRDGRTVPYGYGVSLRPFLEPKMIWHGGNVDSHSTMIALPPEQDLRIVILLARGFVWPTVVMPTVLNLRLPARAAGAKVQPIGRFEDAPFQYEITADGTTLQVSVDLLGRMRFVPVATREFVAEAQPATFRLRVPVDSGPDGFEFDWVEVRSYPRRLAD